MYKFKDKLIIVAREKNDQIKISLRTYHKSKIILPSLVAKALEGLRGTGGGHEHACGTNINKEDFKEYIDRLEHLLKK
jgi:single-stranded DNA-specific DHH superfamily exonuclease